MIGGAIGHERWFMTLIADTAHRAEAQSPSAFNQRIHRQMQQRIACLAGHPDQIRQRLAELDREWDIERCLETGSATLTLTGLVLGATVHKRWFWLSAAVQTFFLQHALQGWCPPLPVFRAMGIRTQREIEAERHALKALLGEYTESEALEQTHAAATGNGVANRIFQKAMA
jgi:hypothetical protein